MTNGFPTGNFRIVNKGTGVCIASKHGGYTHGMQDAVTERGETGKLPYSHTNNRLFTVHDKVKNIEEEIWYFDSRSGYRGQENRLYNKVKDIRSSWVLGATLVPTSMTYKLFDKDLENFLSLLPAQDEETLAYLRTNDCLNIIHEIIHLQETLLLKTEHIGKLDDNKLDDYLNTALVYDTFRLITHDSSKLSEFNDQSEQLYKIIVTALKLNFLYRKNFRINLNTRTLLKKLQKEQTEGLLDKLWKESENVEDPIKEAVKLTQELREDLHLTKKEKAIGNILKASLKSNETFKQLETALNSAQNKGRAVYTYEGDLFLQGAGCDSQTNWAFEDGYIFVEGQPDAVLTITSLASETSASESLKSLIPSLDDLEAKICQRSDDPNQRWELKRA